MAAACDVAETTLASTCGCFLGRCETQPLLPPPAPESSAAALAAGPEQIHLSYTGVLGQLSLDFVCAAGGAGSVGFSVDGKKTWAQVNATFFSYPSIGDMQQALIAPAAAPAPGAALSYFCACADGSKSDVFEVTPVPARYPSEVRACEGCLGVGVGVGGGGGGRNPSPLPLSYFAWEVGGPTGGCRAAPRSPHHSLARHTRRLPSPPVPGTCRVWGLWAAQRREHGTAHRRRQQRRV